MKESILREKSYRFSIEIIKIYKELSEEKKEFVLSKQLLKSWTAVWALIREAEFAQSKADFINKMSISLKEANETQYWLDLLYDSFYLEKYLYDDIYLKCTECIKLLVSTIKTSKWIK